MLSDWAYDHTVRAIEASSLRRAKFWNKIWWWCKTHNI